MLKKALLFASRSNWMRQAAQNSFRLPLIGASLRRAAGQMLPRGQRTWIQINKGPGEGLWIKVEPYWEPGYLQGQPEPFIQEILAEKLKAGELLLRYRRAHRLLRIDRGAAGGTGRLRDCLRTRSRQRRGVRRKREEKWIQPRKRRRRRGLELGWADQLRARGRSTISHGRKSDRR